MPAVAIYSFRRAAFDNLGLKDNDIIAYAKPATPHLEAITANSTTPYITAFTDLQHGPTVLEVPAAGPDGSLYGQILSMPGNSPSRMWAPRGSTKARAARFC